MMCALSHVRESLYTGVDSHKNSGVSVDADQETVYNVEPLKIALSVGDRFHGRSRKKKKIERKKMSGNKSFATYYTSPRLNVSLSSITGAKTESQHEPGP